MEIPPDPTPDMLSLPRFDDDAIDMWELLRRLAEQVVDVAMDAEADQPCGAGPNKSISERRFFLGGASLSWSQCARTNELARDKTT